MPRPRTLRPRGRAAACLPARNNRQATFFADEDYHFYLEWLSDAAKKWKRAIHAYVLMTNHVHLLLTPAKPDSVSKLMQSVGRKYVRYINKHYRRSGTLWEGRCKASLIGSDKYFLGCSRYIELNPARADMVKDPAAYRWSSYARNGLGKADLLINEHPDYSRLGDSLKERALEYRKQFRTELDQKAMDSITRELHQCRAYASERIKEQIEAALKVRLKPGKAGRPPEKEKKEKLRGKSGGK